MYIIITVIIIIINPLITLMSQPIPYLQSVCPVPILLMLTAPVSFVNCATGLWSRSRRLGLQTYQRLVSVSSPQKIPTSGSLEAEILSRSLPFISRAQG